LLPSDTMARLTERLSVNQTSETITALAAALGVSVSAASQIIPALEKSKVVTVTRFGTSKLIAANTQTPFYRPLRELFEIVAGPPVVLLAEEFAGVAGIQDPFIFGPYAARASGVPGRQPNDIDVLVIGFRSGRTCPKRATPPRSAWAAKSTRSSGPRRSGVPRLTPSFAFSQRSP
jgi:hypothetical protein